MEENKFRNIFLANIFTYASKTDFIDGDKLILLEGETDYKFFKKLNNEQNSKFLALDHFLNRVNVFKGEKPVGDTGNKRKIISLVTNSLFDIELSQCIKKLNLHAIVDKDFDDEYMGLNRILSSSNHDLETLILNSDNALLSKIENMCNDRETMNHALYMAYQLSQAKYGLFLSDRWTQYRKIYIDDIERFFDGNILNIKKYINYLVNQYKPEVKNLKNKKNKMTLDKTKLYSRLIDTLKTRKILDIKEQFKVQLKDFENLNVPKDFWQIVNGHDLLQIILYLNQSNPRFNDFQTKYKLEYFLINNYDYNQFKNDTLYSKMKKASII